MGSFARGYRIPETLRTKTAVNIAGLNRLFKLAAYSCAAPPRSHVRSAEERTALPKALQRKAAVNSLRVKYWEIIAHNLSKRGWSWGLRLRVGLRGANDLDC